MIMVIPSVLAQSTGAEDEKNLDLISCDLKLFEIYTKGYVEGCGGIPEQEIRMYFPWGKAHDA